MGSGTGAGDVGVDPRRHFVRQIDGSVSLCFLRLLSYEINFPFEGCP